jgi:hypothetical protein
MIVEFMGFGNDWSFEAYKRAQGKVTSVIGLADMLVEWCPIVLTYKITIPGKPSFELNCAYTRDGKVY